MASLRAILFDCNGIIVDDEHLHLKLFKKVLNEEGIALTKKQYFKTYLAMDDKSCFKHILSVHHRKGTAPIIQGLVDRKAIYYKEAIKKELRIFPGVKSFAKRLKGSYTLAVVSGALRHEINWILKEAGIKQYFSAIVSSEDVKKGKPDPESYNQCLRRLNQLKKFKKHPLKARECIAIEDSIHGVQSVKRAKMNCIAVTNSYSRKHLKEADLVIHSLKGFKLEKINEFH